MSEPSVDILVIGDGISARAMLWKLQTSFKGSVLQVFDNTLYPPSSFNSTGVVAFNGQKKGVSPLGDVLREGVEYFFKNIATCGLMGMEKGQLVDTCIVGDDRLMRRYGKEESIENCDFPFALSSGFNYAREEAVFINPKLFMSSLLEQYFYDFKLKSLVDIKDHSAIFSDGSSINFGKIILCCGTSLTELNALGVNDERPIIEVAGSFYRWDKDLGPDSFALGLGKSNLVYRASDNCLMLGGTTQKDEIVAHDGEELNSFYLSAKKIASSFLPPTDEAEVFSGIRVKGPRRLPLFEELKKDVFVLGAAYKTGWSQAFYGSAKLIEKII
ncbi:MAG: hypothetical protein CME70_01265 [Halobacteriovorax sp.]|nr:hypothetical protein [Halobacteriovorax sp.]|tara:strand:+ start:40972 stop:41958 length:987 start_codon:yes stop_codon:yes gene_type:complete